MTIWKEIQDSISYNKDTHELHITTGVPFDGSNYLIRTDLGIVEAWWDSEAFEWVCHDDMFQRSFDEVHEWAEIPL